MARTRLSKCRNNNSKRMIKNMYKRRRNKTKRVSKNMYRRRKNMTKRRMNMSKRRRYMYKYSGGGDENRAILYYFFSNNCGHCIEFNKTKTWEKLEGNYKKKLIMGKIEDNNNNKSLFKQYEINGYPTIILIMGNDINEYDGGRTYEGISEWLNNKLQD